MSDHDMFKTTIVGGFDKDDVMTQVQHMRDDALAEQKKLQKQVAEQEECITELRKRLKEKEYTIDNLNREIKDKYKKYEENYDNIGKLVFESKVKSDKMIADTEAACAQMKNTAQTEVDAMLQRAKEDAAQMIYSVEKEVDSRLSEGKDRYNAVQNELGQIMQMVNQAQRRFMSSYKEIHRLVAEMPSTFMDTEEEQYEYAEEAKIQTLLDEDEKNNTK